MQAKFKQMIVNKKKNLQNFQKILNYLKMELIWEYQLLSFYNGNLSIQKTL
jgi:hypothetical protein